MREIKFRGKKSKEKNDFMYGYLISHESIRSFDEYNNPVETYHIDENTVGQYTGLKDKNGKEIYEGDIVKIHYFYQREDNTYPREIYEDEYDYIGEILWHLNGFYICNNLKGLKPLIENYEEITECEVIGNIYDNPELLEMEE